MSSRKQLIRRRERIVRLFCEEDGRRYMALSEQQRRALGLEVDALPEQEQRAVTAEIVARFTKTLERVDRLIARGGANAEQQARRADLAAALALFDTKLGEN